MTSKGENKIADILNREGFLFIREKIFHDLKHGKLRFDFYLPEENVAIEVDGIQHFKQVSYFYKTRRDFLRQQENDRRKNSYCLANKIKLYRIPYWELDKINNYSDIIKEKFLVKNRFHNDYLVSNAPKQ